MKPLISRIAIVICFIVIGSTTYSQVSYYKNITPLNGIASATVYDILNDSKGYIWFATDNGVSRYDGFEFVNFTTEDGLPLSSTVSLREDNAGRIWFFAYSGELSYYKNNKIYQYKCNNKFDEYFQNSYLSDIYVDTIGSMWISPMRGGHFILSDQCNMQVVNDEPTINENEEYYLYLKDMGDDVFLTILTFNNKDILKGESFISDYPDYYIKTDYSSLTFQRHCIKLQDSSYIITYKNILFYIVNGELINKIHYDKPIINLSLDDKNNVWVSTLYGGGVMMYPDLNFNRKPKVFFKGKSISKVLQDREKNYWFSTIGDGIYFTTSVGFNIFSVGSGGNRNIIAFAINGDHLYFSTAEKNLYKSLINNDEIAECTELNYPGITNWIFNILPEDDGTLWLAGTKYTKYNPEGQPFEPNYAQTAFSFLRSSDGLTYIGRAGLSIYDDEEILFQEEEIFHDRIYAIGEDIDNTIWMGTLHGLYTFKDSVVQKANVKGMSETRIYCISKFKDFLIVGTGSDGLLFIKNDSVYKKIDKENGLSSNMVKSVASIGDSIIWLAMSDGLNKLSYTNEGLEFSNQWISIYDGMPSTAIQQIEYHNGVIWMGTERGILSFYPENVNLELIPPIITIDKILVNSTEIELSDTIQLDYDYNNIKIFYKGISFRGPEMVRYRYRLIPDNNVITNTNNRYIDFPGLKAGTYTFRVNAGYKNSIWSENPATLVIKIKPHFTSTLWFILIIVLLGLVVILIFVKLVLGYFKRREDNRLRLLRVENRYFRSQLNPHFIFNSLAAIQGFIYKNNKEEAGLYLSKFAKLIRYLMSTNEHEFVSLSRDLVFINNFISVQQLRFGERFEYSINIDENIDPEEIMIPPMMAQPFIENAIEHGFQHKKGKGLLKIEFLQEGNLMIIIIEDNGIGREKSKKIKHNIDKKSRTHSTSIMHERIKLLNQIIKKKVTIQIIDLIDVSGQAAGTKVIINYPI
ncbi:sensor histidine kinase [Bacteroidota bacterium]